MIIINNSKPEFVHVALDGARANSVSFPRSAWERARGRSASCLKFGVETQGIASLLAMDKMKRHPYECSLISSEKGNLVVPCDAERPGIHSHAERGNERSAESGNEEA